MRTRVWLLLRHRWIFLGHPLIFVCHPRVPGALYASPDPLCDGCGATVDPRDVRGYPENFAPSRARNGETVGTDVRLEMLAVALDMCQLTRRRRDAA